jgi:hypothetical protein
MRTYDTSRYKNVILPVELIEQLRSMKVGIESFADLLRRLLKELDELRAIVLSKPRLVERPWLYLRPVLQVKPALVIHPVVVGGD